MRRLLPLLAAVVAVVLPGWAPSSTVARPREGASTATVASVVGLTAWARCADPYLLSYGLQCARLRVPLDYAHPGAGTITLAVTRRPHQSSAASYQGVMLTNPGGPGGSGTWMPIIADYVPGGAGDGYDWIGFDPRGVGASRPALRCNPRYFGMDRPSYVPRNDALTSYWLLKTRRYARACADSPAARLLPFMTTRDTVRDMESLRAALQQQTPAAGPKLNYYGYSYGTYLGEVYANRYPARVGRFVLDSVVDPRRVWYGANLDQDRAFDRNANLWFRYLAAHPRAFRLGTDWQQIRSGYYAELRRLDRHAAAQGRLGPDELNDALVGVGYSARDWMRLGYAYADLVLRGRAGTLLAEYRSGDAADDNGYAVYNAVQCTDVAWPSWSVQRRDTWYLHHRHPFMSWNNTWYNGPCRRWHAPHHARIPVRDQGVRSRILLVSETRDAATPYSGALRVRSIFPTARLVAGRGGTTHASSLSGVSCVDRAVAAYLRDGTTPARRPVRGADLTCPAVQPDRPAGRTAPAGLPEQLRERLDAAQRVGR